MDKTTLLSTQPIATRVLSNALMHQRISHAYLFVGSKGTPKKEMALLMAQSLVCDHPDDMGFACGTCDSCLKISNHTYADMVDIDPYREYEAIKQKESTTKKKKSDGSTKPKPITIPRIGKEQIANLQTFFSTTPLERKGWKIYIINGLERMSEEASNALLKFLEEPNGKDICAILIADSINNVLTTIVSRCQLIRFNALDHRTISKMMVDHGANDLLAVLSGYIWRGETMDEWVNSRSVNDASGAVMQLAASDAKHFRDVAVQIENEVILNNGFTKECGKYIFEMLYVLFMLHFKDPSSLTGITINLHPKNMAHWLLILNQAADKSDKTYHYPLLYEQTIIELSEEL